MQQLVYLSPMYGFRLPLLGGTALQSGVLGRYNQFRNLL